jgi:hypothetical protein
MYPFVQDHLNVLGAGLGDPWAYVCVLKLNITAEWLAHHALFEKC